MPRFLTPPWVEALNAALDGAVVEGPGPEAGLAAVDGRFTVAQEVRDTPDGDVRLILSVEDGSLHFALDPAGAPGGDGEERADVTIALDYDAAAALSRGELAPAEALNAGKIRVRGDLSVLVASQGMMEAAREHTAPVTATTTY
jgi:putative sterol carrier protein